MTPSHAPIGSDDQHPVDTDGVLAVAAALRLGTTRLARRLRREADVDLTPSLLSALSMVYLHGPLTLGSLAELERVTPPTVTKLIGRLEDAQLVERECDPDDRRIHRVAITGAGEALLAESRERKNAWLADRLATLHARDLECLRRAGDLIDRVLADDADGADGASPSGDGDGRGSPR